MKRTLILADNQDITRRGMQALAVTECASLFSTVTEADSRSELTRALLADPEAVAVIDYTLFDCTESQLSALKERFPRAPFILFCDSLNQELTRRLVFSQALFCMLPKDSSLKEIRECLTEATEGRPYLTGKVAAWLKQSGKTTDAVSPLTTTEKEILRAMALGKSTKDIASERFLSIYTVMTHRKNIFRKLGQQRPRSHPSCTPLGPCRRCGILHLNSVFLIKEDSPQKHTAQSKDSAHRCQEAIQRYSCLHIPAAGPAAGLQRQPLPTKYLSASLPAKKVHVLSG